MKLLRSLIALSICLASLSACGSSDLVDLALAKPDRKPIDISKTGVNNFFVDPEFGSLQSQFSDIHGTLGLHAVRVLFIWSDGVEPSPGAPPNYSFYDEVVRNIPAGVRVTVVLAHTPSWMADPANWTAGNPRVTFAERWVRPTVQRYAGVPGIEAWEIWNEPDLTVVASDAALGLTEPANYHELLTYAAREVRAADPGKLVVMGATQSIQQNFPNNLRYNIALRDLGATGLVDVWGVHYYGTRFESVVTDNGVADFLNGLGKPIWITESGAQGPNNQLPYVETAWPFLSEKIPGIQRFYYYQYGSNAPLPENYGLRTTDTAMPVSDLYIYLRDQHVSGG